VPTEVRDDGARAVRAHPGGVLLPAAFMAAELAGGQWQPAQAGTSATPLGARDSLGLYLRVTAPRELRLDDPDRARYAAAADQLDAGRGSDVAAAGRRFRVVRAERLIRIGPDGPEGPRPSDPDPSCPSWHKNSNCATRGCSQTKTRTPRSSWLKAPSDSPGSSIRTSSDARHASETSRRPDLHDPSRPTRPGRPAADRDRLRRSRRSLAGNPRHRHAGRVRVAAPSAAPTALGKPYRSVGRARTRTLDDRGDRHRWP